MSKKPHISFHFNAATHGAQNPVRIVLHDTESHDIKGIRDLQGIANFWKMQNLGYGAHFIVDAEGKIAQGASSNEVCWHVADNNTGSIGIEQIGFARFTPKIWYMRQKQLRKVAKLLAYLSSRWGIPLEHGTVHGVCLHADFHGGHTDPGRGYPFKRVLKWARKYKHG